MRINKIIRKGRTIELRGSFRPGELRTVLEMANRGEFAMPMQRDRYPDNWEEISHQIRFVRAGGKCEGTPDYPDCQAAHGQPHPETGSIVVLTTAHLGVPYPDGTPGDKHDKMDVRQENLAALCQRCHLNLDRDEHRTNAAATRRRKAEEAGQLPIFE